MYITEGVTRIISDSNHTSLTSTSIMFKCCGYVCFNVHSDALSFPVALLREQFLLVFLQTNKEAEIIFCGSKV